MSDLDLGEYLRLVRFAHRLLEDVEHHVITLEQACERFHEEFGVDVDDDARSAEAGVFFTSSGPMASYTKQDMALEARDMVLDICNHYSPDTARLLRLLLWLYLKGDGARPAGRQQSPAEDRKPRRRQAYYDAVRAEYRQLVAAVGKKNANACAAAKALAAMPDELKITLEWAQREARFAQTKLRRK